VGVWKVESHARVVGGLLAAFVAVLSLSMAQPTLAMVEDSHDHGAHGDSHDGDDSHDSHDDSHGEDDSHGHGDHDEGHHEYEALRLTPSEMEEFDVKLESASGARIANYVALPGEVVVNADRVAHIVPRYAGIVKVVKKSVGDSVENGDVLAVIESSESLSDYELKTLLSGTVIGKHITRGEAVTRDSQAFIIADLSDVWIELSVYQRDLARVRTGQRVSISSGHDFPEREGEISYVSPVVDEHTRTALARVVMDNASGAWRPGMFVTGRVALQSVDVAVAIPLTAIQTVGDRTTVFVQDDDGFEPRRVELGRRSATLVEVVSGLARGERYVASGGFILKAELGRSELGHGHAH